METNKERLSKEIDAVINRTMPRFSSIKICEHTPKLLLDLGLDDYPILFSQRHTRDCLHPKDKNPHHHGLTKDFLLNMPLYLENPAMVLDSLSNPYSIVVLTGEVDGDNIPILASITINGDGIYEAQKIDSNYMTSVYGKDNLENIIEDYIASDNVLYVNKEKTQNLESFAKLQLLGKFSKDFEFDTIIHESNNIVNEDDAIIASFREKTDKLFNRYTFGGLSPEEIEDDVRAYISKTLYMKGLNHNVEIDDVIIVGSRSRGINHPRSDLDIVFSYKSPVVEGTRGYKEDELFNLLNEYDENNPEDKMLHELHGHKIDINPIRPEETGNLSDYLLNAEKNLEEKKEKQRLLDERVFGKGNWCAEWIKEQNAYRLYSADYSQGTIAYVDTKREILEEARERGRDVFFGSVYNTWDEENNVMVPHFHPEEEDVGGGPGVIAEPGLSYGEGSENRGFDIQPERMVKMQNRLDIERLYTLDELYEEADGKAHLSPELKRKDEALIEFTDWLHDNGYMAERSAFDSWEDAMDHTIKAWNISALFSENGTLLYVREGDTERLNSLEKDYIYELSDKQINDMLDDFSNDKPSLPEGLFL